MRILIVDVERLSGFHRELDQARQSVEALLVEDNPDDLQLLRLMLRDGIVHLATRPVDVVSSASDCLTGVDGAGAAAIELGSSSNWRATPMATVRHSHRRSRWAWSNARHRRREISSVRWRV